ERRVALLVADARDLHRYRVGKALGMGGGEQQPATGVELERVVAAPTRIHVEAGQQAVACQVMTQRQYMDAVVQAQLAGGVNEHLVAEGVERLAEAGSGDDAAADRKSTRLNSSHVKISYAVFCL